jgi:hypothetical protein
LIEILSIPNFSEIMLFERGYGILVFSSQNLRGYISIIEISGTQGKIQKPGGSKGSSD